MTELHVEKVAGPLNGATGGLAWDGGGMLFAAIDEQRLLRFDPVAGTVAEIRKHTHRTNGIAFAADGSLYGCQELGRRVIEFCRDGSARQTAYKLGGRFHNQPTDLAPDSLGRIWFCDPRSDTRPPGVFVFPPLEHASVLRLERDAQRHWRLRRITFDTVAPRALTLSPDERTLYVADGGVSPASLPQLRSYPINADGGIGEARILAEFPGDYRGSQRGIEGMTVDGMGNIVACGGCRKSGPGPFVTVYSPQGLPLRSFPLPFGSPNRCKFGDKDLGTLYVTSMDGCLYRLSNTGLRGRSPKWLPAQRGGSDDFVIGG